MALVRSEQSHTLNADSTKVSIKVIIGTAQVGGYNIYLNGESVEPDETAYITNASGNMFTDDCTMVGLANDVRGKKITVSTVIIGWKSSRTVVTYQIKEDNEITAEFRTEATIENGAAAIAHLIDINCT